MAKRYDQMFPIIQEIQPRTIVEVGVHRGIRGAKLCGIAVESGLVEYTGYDVFNTMSASFQAAALNGKGAPSAKQAQERLARIDGLSFKFVIGDTRKTLHGKRVVADFAFIDGDHRVDAIIGDYAALADSKCVVFDDFYEKGPNGELPNLDKFGANKVVKAAQDSGKRVEILPIKDKCNHGAFAKLAVVWL